MDESRTRGAIPAPRTSGGASGVVVAAVDGSTASVRALEWALEYAAEHALRLEVLTMWPLRGTVFVREVSGHFCQPRWDAREAQAAATARALAAVPNAPPYELRVENADVASGLVQAAERADLLVLGSDRLSADPPDHHRLPEHVRSTVPGTVVVVYADGIASTTTAPGAVRR